MVMDYDDECDSFKKPGAVPFKWEVKPGVPIISHHHNNHQKPWAKLPEPPSPKPPPAGSYLFSPGEPRSGSFRSTPRVRSDRFRFNRPLLSRPESVSSGCFFSPFLRRLKSKKTIPKRVTEPENESSYSLDLEMLSRCSFSSRKSISPFRISTTSSSSVASSPRPIGDTEWAGFGLF
ncbi:hypothetical protein RIF29_11684 [Crotalaria pallida]|uniref:Uncharacterized protein n=1 Tax=Crotalaria pallida TaxID=3830 RepID=A0AAN9IME6_CROPI